MGLYSHLVRLMCAIAWVVLSFWPLAAEAAPAQATVEWLSPDSSSAEYRRAEGPAPLKFPRDFGAHPDYQTEWWYYTGNLETDEGREFGYQFTIFRRAIEPNSQFTDSSDWRSNQIYFSHFTVSDVEGNSFYPQERFSRGSAELAGAQPDPYRVWINDWSMDGEKDGRDQNTVHLQAESEQVAIDLQLAQSRPPVLQGDRGYSAKGPEPGNASYYYSIVQQPTQGTVRIGNEVLKVTGKSWKDHEYSTSALSPGTAGWDWFSIQFDNDAALMLYVLRQEDGTPLDFSKGNYIDSEGNTTPLSKEDWELSVLKQWKSPKSGATYPAAWRISIPKLELAIQGQPLMPNQELDLSTVYWEGAVQFTGTHQEQPTEAKGYVELTGYKESLTALN